MEQKIVDFRVKPPTLEFGALYDPQFFQSSRVERYIKSGMLKFPELTPIEAFIDVLDENGIAKAVIFARDIESTHGFRIPNEAVAKLINKYPDRLIGFAGVDPHKGMAAVRETERCIRELGFVGVCLEPFLQQLYSNDKKYYPIYAKCAELGAMINVVTGAQGFVRPLSNIINYCSPLPLDEVATDFPELTIATCHPGTPWNLEMIYIARRHPSLYVEMSGITTGYRIGSEVLVQAANEVIPDQVLYASTYPMEPLTQYKEFMKLPFLPEVMEKLLYKNAARLFEKHHRR
jgi:uncharacterized protein